MKSDLAIRFVLFIWLFVASSICTAQIKADSLLQYLKTNESKLTCVQKNDLLNQVAEYYINQQVVKSLEYAKQALEISITCDYPRGKAKALINLGLANHLLLKDDEAVKYFGQALTIASDIGYEQGLASIYNQLGEIHKNSGDSTKALEFFSRCLKLAEKNDSILTYEPLSHIGEVYSINGDYSTALDYFFKALEQAEKYNDKRMFIANVNAIGRIYHLLGDHQKANGFHNQSLSYARQNNLKAEEVESLYLLGRLNNDLNNTAQAIRLLNQALNIAQQSNLKRQMMEIHGALANSYSARGDFKAAYQHHQLFYALNDTINLASNKSRIENLNLLYEIEKKESDTKLEMINLDKKNLFIYTIVVIIVLLLAIIGLLIKRYFDFKETSRQLTEQQEKIYTQEKEIILKKTENLNRELEYKEKELTAKAMYLIKSHEYNEKLIEWLTKLNAYTNTTGKEIIQKLLKEHHLESHDETWKEFEYRFEQVHKTFFDNLNRLHPDLTPNEKKLAAFLRLNMTTKDIASITYQTVNSINVARTRLRRRMGISTDTNLITYLAQF